MGKLKIISKNLSSDSHQIKLISTPVLIEAIYKTKKGGVWVMQNIFAETFTKENYNQKFTKLLRNIEREYNIKLLKTA